MLCGNCEAKVWVYTEAPKSDILSSLNQFREDSKGKPVACETDFIHREPRLEDEYSRFEKDSGL